MKEKAKDFSETSVSGQKNSYDIPDDWRI